MWIAAKFDSRCNECKDSIQEGDRVYYDTKERKVYCAECGEHIESDPQKDESLEDLRKRAKVNVRSKK